MYCHITVCTVSHCTASSKQCKYTVRVTVRFRWFSTCRRETGSDTTWEASPEQRERSEMDLDILREDANLDGPMDPMQQLLRAASNRELFDTPPTSGKVRRASYFERQTEILSFVASLPGEKTQTGSKEQQDAKLALRALVLSFGLNVVLFALKVVAFLSSGSLALLTSLLDSALDLLSGLVLWGARRAASKQAPYEFPLGRSRMEPLGVVVFATIMAVSSMQIIVESIRVIAAGLDGDLPEISFDLIVQIIAAIVIGSKGIMSVYCYHVAKVTDSSSVLGYADDHRNDVFTNLASIVCVVIVTRKDSLWFLDAVGAICIALWIVWAWVETAKDSIDKLVGRAVDPVLISQVIYLAATHHPLIKEVDTVRGYYCGERCVIECHVVLPRDVPLHVSHDIGESLEIKIESLEKVGRAFVHNDWESSHAPEHQNTYL